MMIRARTFRIFFRDKKGRWYECNVT